MINYTFSKAPFLFKSFLVSPGENEVYKHTIIRKEATMLNQNQST